MHCFGKPIYVGPEMKSLAIYLFLPFPLRMETHEGSETVSNVWNTRR
jgi:hypothetical protein